LLAHQPKITKELKNENIDLILSGHTHAGQIFPFGLLVLLDQPYLSGLYQHSKKTQIFVSSGAGYWGPPIRVLAPSEIVNIKVS
jgi:predicted MPP superfamily phosphohydrolase